MGHLRKEKTKNLAFSTTIKRMGPAVPPPPTHKPGGGGVTCLEKGLRGIAKRDNENGNTGGRDLINLSAQRATKTLARKHVVWIVWVRIEEVKGK